MNCDELLKGNGMKFIKAMGQEWDGNYGRNWD